MTDDKKDKTCDLCGLAIGRNSFTRSFDDEEKSFCCLGCMNVYAILLESGVIASGQNVRETEVFQRSLALGVIATGGKEVNSKLPPIPQDALTQEVLLQVSGMWCSSCAWLIEHTLTKERGVISAEAFFSSDLVKVKYCPQYVPPDRITERIGQLGYKASEYTGENDTANAERRDLLLRLGISAFLQMNVMTLSMALYVGYFEKISESISRYLPFVLMLLTAPIVFYSAMPILRLAWRGLVNGVVRMETLLGLGILAAYFYSSAQAFLGGTHYYFDTAGAIVTLVLVGKLIERGAKERTSRAVALLYRMMPKKVRLLESGFGGKEEKFVSVDALNVGDVFVVKAGERIPADGILVDGSSHADESLLTGESTPVEKQPGSRVVAGSLNTGNVIQVRAEKVGEDATLAQIIRMVEQALSSKSSLERTVDKVSRVFVPGVIVFAVLTFLVCWLGGFATTDEALMRAITVLVIACPCALGMATPLALTAAIGSASQRGILVSDSRVLETVRHVDAVVFDKTGTITEGNFALLKFEPVQARAEALSSVEMARSVDLLPQRALRTGIEEVTGVNEEALQLVASLERYSEHPLGRAVMKRAQEDSIKLLEAREVEIRKGLGLIGNVAGHSVFVGNRRLAEDQCVPGSLADWSNPLASQGRTVAYFGWDGQVRGVMEFGDRIRQEAADVLKDLKQRGVKTLIVSGDSYAATSHVASIVGADEFIAEALPNEKTSIIAQMQQQGTLVAMVGDGVNDAPALAQADLGIAVGSGTDVAMRAAAIVLMSHAINKLPLVFDLANTTWRIVRQNLFWAFFYNTLGISLAVTGMLNPIIAAGAMLLSSLSVIGNSLRLTSRK
ncbi:MAG: heavy metal translocating P-type ATPase [Acidobacteria bacterium]|nr:heavy metal translocating P-type ATPase [Acidobacteriota bacterium]